MTRTYVCDMCPGEPCVLTVEDDGSMCGPALPYQCPICGANTAVWLYADPDCPDGTVEP